jgi:hypothetical protein
MSIQVLFSIINILNSFLKMNYTEDIMMIKEINHLTDKIDYLQKVDLYSNFRLSLFSIDNEIYLKPTQNFNFNYIH